MSVNCSTGFRAAILGASSFESLFDGGCIEIYSGAQPASADMAPTGILLGRITANGGAWSNGNAANGLKYQRIGHRATNLAGQPWVLKGIADGAAGWFRMRAVSDADDESTTAVRIDGAIGTLEAVGAYQMRLNSLALSASTAAAITSWWFVFPPID